jgi:hypothetical protein
MLRYGGAAMRAVDHLAAAARPAAFSSCRALLLQKPGAVYQFQHQMQPVPTWQQRMHATQLHTRAGLLSAAATGRFAILVDTLCSSGSPKNIASLYDDMIAETREAEVIIKLYDDMVARGFAPALNTSIMMAKACIYSSPTKSRGPCLSLITCSHRAASLTLRPKLIGHLCI